MPRIVEFGQAAQSATGKIPTKSYYNKYFYKAPLSSKLTETIAYHASVGYTVVQKFYLADPQPIYFIHLFQKRTTPGYTKKRKAVSARNTGPVILVI